MTLFGIFELHLKHIFMTTDEQRFRQDLIAQSLGKRIQGMDVRTWIFFRSHLIMSGEYDDIRSTKDFKNALYFVAEIIDEFDRKRLSKWITYDYGSNTETKYLLSLLTSINTREEVDDDSFVTDQNVEDLKVDLGFMIKAQEQAAELEQHELA